MKKLILLLFLLLSTVACVPEISGFTPTPWPTTVVTQQSTPKPRETIESFGITQTFFLTQNPCSAPCFFGITPGFTTEEETNALLDEYPSVFNACDFEDDTKGVQERWLLCEEVAVCYKDGYVVSIHYYVEPTLSIQQLIEIYGPPDQLKIIHTNIPEETPVISPFLYYNQIQTILFLPDFEGTQYNITPETTIWVIYHVSISEFPAWISDYEELVPWDGYGIYEVTEK